MTLTDIGSELATLAATPGLGNEAARELRRLSRQCEIADPDNAFVVTLADAIRSVWLYMDAAAIRLDLERLSVRLLNDARLSLQT